MANTSTSAAAYPAAFNRAAIRSAARVQLPAESVVLVSTSSLKISRNASWSGRGDCAWAGGEAATALNRAA
ncbi:MAG: hypothetical protein ACK53I_07335, partial [Phenylobacterium sp.]